MIFSCSSKNHVKFYYHKIKLRGNGVNGQTIIPTFVKLLKEDDSVLASSMAIVTAVRLWKLKPNLDLSELTAVVDIQDLFAQADSFDKQLSFDGDIVTTSYFIQVSYPENSKNEKLTLVLTSKMFSEFSGHINDNIFF